MANQLVSLSTAWKFLNNFWVAIWEKSLHVTIPPTGDLLTSCEHAAERVPPCITDPLFKEFTTYLYKLLKGRFVIEATLQPHYDFQNII